jgi:hypothetical protein
LEMEFGALVAAGSRGAGHGACFDSKLLLPLLLLLWWWPPRPALFLSGLLSTDPVDRRKALYLRDGISASAGFDSALALSDDRWDEPECLFVGVAVALETCVCAVRGRWSGVRGDEGLLLWRLETSALRRVVAWRSNTDGRWTRSGFVCRRGLVQLVSLSEFNRMAAKADGDSADILAYVPRDENPNKSKELLSNARESYI